MLLLRKKKFRFLVKHPFSCQEREESILWLFSWGFIQTQDLTFLDFIASDISRCISIDVQGECCWKVCSVQSARGNRKGMRWGWTWERWQLPKHKWYFQRKFRLSLFKMDSAKVGIISVLWQEMFSDYFHWVLVYSLFIYAWLILPTIWICFPNI